MKKVTLISPCYNGKSYVTRFLDSLVDQTYKNVEFIFVNDGSTDNTEEIFLEYKQKLQDKGWSVIYIYQENSGQASAINKGLEIFTGDYLIFPDSDDILYPNHIENKVKFMENHPNCGVAFNIVDIVQESNTEKICRQSDNFKLALPNFVDNLLQFNLAVWTPVSWIIRSDFFLKSNPFKQIYPGRAGQNFQLLYPVAKMYPVEFMHESLAKYVVRELSHSHLSENSIRNPKRVYALYDIVLNTIFNTPIPIEKKLIDVFKTQTYFLPKFSNENQTQQNKKKIYLLKKIPLFKIKIKNNRTKIYFLGIPFLTIKEKE